MERSFLCASSIDVELSIEFSDLSIESSKLSLEYEKLSIEYDRLSPKRDFSASGKAIQ